MNRVETIREEEKRYHDAFYATNKLFEAGSWMHKPVKMVLELLPYFEGKDNVRVLDLGSGVGRNSIPIAKAIKDRNGKVVCVDLLESALTGLEEYSRDYGVDGVIQAVQADIGNFEIAPETYDFIVAVSTLEHVQSEELLEMVLQRLAAGTKPGGINCLIVNSEVEERDMATNEALEVFFEVNLSTQEMKEKLAEAYLGWEVLKSAVIPQEFTILRGEKQVLLKANVIAYVVRKGRKGDRHHPKFVE